MKREIVEGIIQGNERGYGFLMPIGSSQDYFIPHSDLKGAMHKDLVLAETTDGVGARTTARVLKIIKRGLTEIVGTFFSFKGAGFVTPDDDKYFTDIFIPLNKTNRAKSGDKVVCKILAYPKKKNPEGIVTEILGRQYNKHTEIKSILRTYNLEEKFPKKVTDEAKNITTEITEEEISKRQDLRNVLCFTIDGEDARDFDDAVSIEKLADGYMLGVHIADVSHYVREGGAIETEAFNRATSVYFPEKVIPMLPEILCNEVCSLVEGKDRLTLSCIMKVDFNGKVVDYKITPSVINSKKRLTYTQVQKLYDGENLDIDLDEDIVKSLFVMKNLALILHEKRYLNGCIDLDVKESAIFVDKQGEIKVEPAKKDLAHGIIEEFMILTNCIVAEYCYFLELPFVYRVHDKPREDRLENFYEFLSGLGISVKRKKDQVFPKDFQRILENAEESPSYPIINRIMLRTMQKAVYSPKETGHFGLNEKYYAHFTSPIRRYPDLTIHRIIKDFLRNGQEFVVKKYDSYVENASKQSSDKERNAIEAERAVDDYYKMLYISDFIGEEFSAIVSGVKSFGVFAELDNSIEGLIKLENLRGGRYNFDEKNLCLSNGKYKFKIGMALKIKVAGIDYAKRRAEFILCD